MDNKVNGFCYDVEADGFVFESTKIWVIWLKDLNDPSKKIKLNPFKDKNAKDKFLEFIDSYDEPPLVVGHNILGYDQFGLRALMDLNFKVGKKDGDEIEGRIVRFADTYYWSMYLNPDRGGHSIEDFGETLGLPKIDFRQASIDMGIIPKGSPEGAEFKQHSETMDEYCERDVDVNIKTFFYLLKEHTALYGWNGEFPSHFKAGQKAFFLMSCQDYSGFKFDVDAGKKLLVRIGEMMEEIRADVEPKLPPRSLKKGEQKEYTMPAKPFKKDGSLSNHMLKFIEKHDGKVVDSEHVEFFGTQYKIVGGTLLDVSMPMEMANQQQMKEWFLESGWEPTMWNYKRGPDNKPMRDPKTRQLIPTSPKIQEAGKLCPNLESMEGPIIKQVVKWLSLRNRQSVLTGWLENERLNYDGRIGAGRSGIAATHRQKHKVVVNVPKASEKVLLGKEFRSLWIAEEGNLIAAGDAAAIEGRVQGHYCWKYDDGVTAEELLKGDVHSKNAKAFYAHDLIVQAFDLSSPDFNKDDPKWKPFRDRSKNGYYALMYGAAAAKLASTLGITLAQAEAALKAFWDANPGTKALKDAVEGYWETVGKKKYLPAIDGRKLMTRKKSALLNTIFQSCGGIIMDYACCFMDMWLGDIYFDEKRRPYYLYKGEKVMRIGYFHDEMEFETKAWLAPEICKMIEKSIEKAGQYLKIKVPLAGEGKYGLSWCETH